MVLELSLDSFCYFQMLTVSCSLKILWFIMFIVRVFTKLRLNYVIFVYALSLLCHRRLIALVLSDLVVHFGYLL